jgi:hypothetical protein
MADLRHKVIDKMVNPAIMHGLIVIAGSITLDNTKTATVTFPAKSVLSSIGVLGTAGVAGVATVTDDVASVVFTAGANGTLQYIIVASETETIALTDAGTADVVITPKQ